jgi:hypothetical protein
MSNKITGPVAICGCGGNSNNFQCCQVADLGMIYEKEPEYETGNPCKQARIDTIVDTGEGVECNTEYTESPHGRILNYRRACARLVVWTGAKIKGSISYNNKYVLYSRQRADLPTEDCQNPIICPAENEIYTCCNTSNTQSRSQTGGPYDGCSVDEDLCETDCSGATPQIYKFGMSNCSLDGNILAGYAIAPSNWWFLNSDEYQVVENQIIQNNPYGEAPVTIYAHFQVEWKPIRCDTRGGFTSEPCNGEGRINDRAGRCGGQHNVLGLVDKDEREKAVKITVAIGWSLGDCGYTPQEACNKI